MLWRATVEGEWTMMHQLAILDNPEMIPISYKSYSIYKMVHFYYIKQVTSNVLPSLEIVRSNAYLLCLKLINLINEASDYRRNKVINRILEFRYGEENNDVDFSVLMNYSSKIAEMKISIVFTRLSIQFQEKRIYMDYVHC